MSKQFEVENRDGNIVAVVPDGQWVAEMDETEYHYLKSGWQGPSKREADLLVGNVPYMKRLIYRDRFETVGGECWYQHSLIVSDKPFGIVSETGDFSTLQPARQVQNGKLGRKPGVSRKPYFVQDGLVNLGMKETWVGWARVTELAAIIGMDCRTMLRRYFSFAPLQSGRGYQLLTTIVARDGAEVTEGRGITIQLRQSQHRPDQKPSQEPPVTIPASFLKYRAKMCKLGLSCRWQRRLSLTLNNLLHFNQMWVPSNWAMTVLYSHELGYTPPERSSPATE